jgi:hypothetical protein
VEPNRNNPFTDSFLAAEVAEMERVCLQTLEMPGVRSDYRQYAEVCLDLNSCSLPGGKVFKEYCFKHDLFEEMPDAQRLTITINFQ